MEQVMVEVNFTLSVNIGYAEGRGVIWKNHS